MIIEFKGNLGSGKSIGMSCLGYLAMQRNEKVYANFKLGDFSHPFDTISDIKKARNGMVLIDDIITWFDSRASIKNYKVSWFYTKGRKFGLTIVYGSQVDTGADYRLRAITNVFIETELIEFPYFLLKFYNPDGDSLGECTIKYSEDVYSLYDTYEVIEQKLSLSDIKDVMSDCGSKDVFSHVLNVRYNIPMNLGRLVFDMIKNENKYLAELLEGNGYVLMEV